MTIEQYITLSQKDNMKNVAAKLLAEYFKFEKNAITNIYLDINVAITNNYLQIFFKETGLSKIVGLVYPNTIFNVSFKGDTQELIGQEDLNKVLKYFISSSELFKYIVSNSPYNYVKYMKNDFNVLNDINSYGANYSNFLQKFYSNLPFSYPSTTNIFIKEDFETNGGFGSQPSYGYTLGTIFALQTFLYKNYNSVDINTYFQELFIALNINVENSLNIVNFNKFINKIFVSYGWGIWNQKVDVSMDFINVTTPLTFTGTINDLQKFQSLFITPDQLEDLINNIVTKNNVSKNDIINLNLATANAIYNINN